jgi:DNA modification methylase
LALNGVTRGFEAMILSDARRVPLAAGSVHMVVTSPPYWGLRDYGVSDQLGLERIPDCLGWATKVYCGECYICHLLEWAREVKRVLRDDGTFWLNIGDSMAGSGNGSGDYRDEGASISKNNKKYQGQKPGLTNGLRPKSLIGIPQRAMLALQADGWIVRNDIIWHKPNPMPESCGDRCTKSHEYIFLLAKQGRYYYDAIAVEEQANYDGRKDEQYKGSAKYKDSGQTFAKNGHPRWKKNDKGERSRNRRDVWTLTTRAYKGSHYATFPPQLPEICIRAGTSERGCCPACGKQWVRVVEKKAGTMNIRVRDAKKGILDKKSGLDKYTASDEEIENYGKEVEGYTKTLFWRADCKCEAGDPIPSTVLDPFGGSGTTVMVATKLRRIGIGLDLDPRNAALEARRLAAAQLEII